MTILFLNYDAKGYPDRNIFAPPLKFAIFANMMGDNRTITYVSDSTCGSYSDYLWTTSRASEIPTPTDMAIEKSGATETKIKFGHKLYCTPGISIKTLAKHIGINSNYLSNYINHTLGITFHTWLHTLRIQEAKRIISADPSMTWTDRHCRLDRQSQVVRDVAFYLKCTIFVHYNVHKLACFMVIISSAELRNNMKKYLDIAKNEKVVIQRGRNETFVLVAQNNAAEEDLNRAITVDEVLARVREGLNEMFERKRIQGSGD